MRSICANNVIAKVASLQLCSGCGVCAALCPENHLTMNDASNGDLIVSWKGEPCSLNCGICLTVCPFSNGEFDPRPAHEALFKDTVSMRFHEDVGYYLRAYAGFSKDNRSSGASGGLLTWTLEELLKKNMVDKIAIVRGDYCQSKKKYCFYFKEAMTIDEIRQSGGSVYHQVEISGLLREIIKAKDLRWALTGVPCLCAAVRNALAYRRKSDSVPYVLGMACGMYQNRYYTELLTTFSGIKSEDVTHIRYRIKPSTGLANNYNFQAMSRTHETGKLIAYKGLPLYLGKNAFFRCNSCNFCKDVFAEYADACFMDAWLPEYMHDLKGTSMVVVRNPELSSMLYNGKSEGLLSLNEIGIEKIVSSQSGHVYRKRKYIEMRKGILIDSSTGEKFSLSNRLEWMLQRRVQQRSKYAWLKHGNGFHGILFWLSIADIVIAIWLMDLYRKCFVRSIILISRIFKRIYR
ncbi:MAG: Coenzyme F420 hydrogenase/dehydrogenase, beta subunit C-terminal domain [Chitinivibrionales bacterium]|nr:Coenzyme F420 hydrogenase/dehydrogenase, beta subunit C-terminal domain [Chitinivibrionales bacterium]